MDKHMAFLQNMNGDRELFSSGNHEISQITFPSPQLREQRYAKLEYNDEAAKYGINCYLLIG